MYIYADALRPGRIYTTGVHAYKQSWAPRKEKQPTTETDNQQHPTTIQPDNQKPTTTTIATPNNRQEKKP
jgi:hypothetical protein